MKTALGLILISLLSGAAHANGGNAPLSPDHAMRAQELGRIALGFQHRRTLLNAAETAKMNSIGKALLHAITASAGPLNYNLREPLLAPGTELAPAIGRMALGFTETTQLLSPAQNEQIRKSGKAWLRVMNASNR